MESPARGCSGSRFFCAPGPAVQGRSSRAPSPARHSLDLDHALLLLYSPLDRWRNALKHCRKPRLTKPAHHPEGQQDLPTSPRPGPVSSRRYVNGGTWACEVAREASIDVRLAISELFVFKVRETLNSCVIHMLFMFYPCGCVPFVFLPFYWPGFLQCACGLTARSHGWISQIGLTDGSHNGLTKRSHNRSHKRSHKKVSQNKVSQKKVSQKGLTRRSHKKVAPRRRTGAAHRSGAPVRPWSHKTEAW